MPLRLPVRAEMFQVCLDLALEVLLRLVVCADCSWTTSAWPLKSWACVSICVRNCSVMASNWSLTSCFCASTWLLKF